MFAEDMPLDLTPLLSLIEENPWWPELAAAVEKGSDGFRVQMPEAAKPFVIAALHHHLKKPMLVVTAQPENAKRLYEQAGNWYDSGVVKLFPDPEALPYEKVSADSTVEIERLQVLAAMTGASKNPPALVIVSAQGLSQRLPSPKRFENARQTIKAGSNVKPLELLAQWQAIGYRLEDLVEMPGTMSRRGGIVDIYPTDNELPARLEFFGDTVESIRLFDPATQCSLRGVNSIDITPASEKLAGETEEADNLLSYLGSDGRLIIDEPDSIGLAWGDLNKKAVELREEMLAQGELSADSPRPYFTFEDIAPLVGSRQHLVFRASGTDEDGLDLGFSPAPIYAGQLPAFVRKVREMQTRGQRVILVSQQSSRLVELLEGEGLIAPCSNEIESVPAAGTLVLLHGSLAEGWVNARTGLFTDAEIFGFVKQQRQIKKHPVPSHKLYIDIKPGDYVVHAEHGVGRFAGVKKMGSTTLPSTPLGTGTTGSAPSTTEREYLVLEYAAGDKLYVPTDQVDRVTRYIGSGERTPGLSRLGTQEWSKVKERVEKAVADIAEELLDLYAARQVVPGFAFPPDTIWQREMESSFAYVETPDQIEAIDKVKEDMETPRPMDRLVCGDVGYGKTEVAIRAAFKAVTGGKQVAVLVPTTVLAEQHYATFKERLSAFPLRVEALSRFRSHREQKEIIEGLADGSVDICIGTHRMIQKDVVFKNLGLLIIDEEQRFGVAHKEFLKKKRQEVHVLALSATPIPRTMHMSLIGVRDMSVMETPPDERLPIKTYFAEYNDRLVREAILRELERNGQVFFVHNRVQSIAFIAGKLKELVPEAGIAIAHGRMNEEDLERVMTEFVQGRVDVLVCTSIIESGLDLPNANTMIINNADKFGLSQLYQLRGRVGRGTNLAYTYLLYEKGKRLTPVGEKRLRTIFEATGLGAGFGIAMKDLEIRGAGTLLGVRQSGHISAVGFNLYTQLLAQAVDELKAKRAGKSPAEMAVSHLPQPSIELPLRSYIPEEYVADLEIRIALYQKLTKVSRLEEIKVLEQEFADRFGEPPQLVRNLLYAVKVKVLAAKSGIESISTQEGELVIRRFEGMRFNVQKVEPFLRGLRLPAGSWFFDTLQLRLNPKRIGERWRGVLEEVVGKIQIG
ncbi:MAG: transcription-repair coupling factor [Dehalococcoidales bacterium]|nr:transcription-repair coupling factor [Dehalococcoidales bacterium]